MKFGVITFPGSNCDRDLVYIIQEQMRIPVVSLWYKETDLKGCNVVFLPGGFSYGDYLRSGAIARFAPIMKEVTTFVRKGGMAIGICNGFQILTESGLLPGALVRNKNQRFVCKNVFIKPASKQHSMFSFLKDRPYKVPIAHAEGNYYCDASTLQMLQDNGQILFTYSDASGNETEESNPNGSLANIAGISNRSGNVIAMMPHPERAADPFTLNTDGFCILQALLKMAEISLV